MIWHENAPGQANGQFGHKDDWAEFCDICISETSSKLNARTYMTDEEFLESLDADILQP